MQISPGYVLATFERVLVTYLSSFIGLLVVNTSGVNLSALHSAAVASIPAALSLAYSALAGMANGTPGVVTPPAMPAGGVMVPQAPQDSPDVEPAPTA